MLAQQPQILIKNAGFEDLDMVVKASTICKICFDHGVSTPIIQRLPVILDKPKALYESATHADSAVVMTYEQHNASPIVVAVQRGQLIGRNHKCNVVASMYGKQGHDPEVRWKRQGLLLWEA